MFQEELFARVQRVLKNKGHNYKQYITDNPDFPLRRFVLNPNSKKLSGCWSQGKYKKYPYYRFYGKGKNFKKDKFEEQFMEFFDRLNFDERQVKNIKEWVKKELIKRSKNGTRKVAELKKYISTLNEQQSTLIQKNLKGIINDALLKKQLDLIDKELVETDEILATTSTQEPDFDKVFSFIEPFIKSPSKIWEKSKVKTQMRLQEFAFPKGLIFDGEELRTLETGWFLQVKSNFSGTFTAWCTKTMKKRTL